MALTFRNDTERKQYEYCRDEMFPYIKYFKAKARKNMAEKEAKRKAEEEKS